MTPSKFFFYPKAAASYLFTRPFGFVDELKIRGAYGQTGNRAAFGALFSPDTTGTIGGSSGTFIGTRAGDPTLEPERQKEFEGGFDATMANGRAQLTFTYYQKNIHDLLLERTLAPSSGQQNQIFSSTSSMRNQGVEAALTVQPVQNRNVNWILRTTFYANKAKITKPHCPDVPDRWLRALARNFPDRAGQLADPDLRVGGVGCQWEPGRGQGG